MTTFQLVRFSPWEGHVLLATYTDRDFAYHTAAFHNCQRPYLSTCHFVVREVA